MQFKGLFVGETCTGTGAVQTLAGAYELETGVNTIPFADAYADGAIVPFVLLASNGVNRLEGQAVFDDAGTLTLSPWVIWNGTTYETYDGSGFTLPAGTHRIYVSLGEYSSAGITPYSAVNRGGNTFQAPDNILRSDNNQDFGTAGAIYLANAFYASPVLFNQLAIYITDAGAAESTVEAGFYQYRERTIFQDDCGDPGKRIAFAEFDATITGLQFVSVPLQIMPPSRSWSATWSEDSTVRLKRSQERTHSGPYGLWNFNNGGDAVLRLNGQPGLVADLSGEAVFAQEGGFRGHIVGLAYDPA
jgi:hypothetical protein